MYVSAALIVKNEAKTLGRCLQSIRGHVDEIVVVDTGSSDATRDIARQYTDRLAAFPWCQNFAAARQYAFDLATGDWVFWLDADDVVLNADSIRPSVRHASADVQGFYWKYIAGRDAYGHTVCEFWRERCVRHNGTFRWVGKAHEVLMPQRPCVLVRQAKIVVVHQRDPSHAGQHTSRNIDILLQEYEQTRANPEPRLLLYLGNEYADLGHLEQALTFYHQYLPVSPWDEEKYLTQVKVAGIYRGQGKYHDAVDADLQALKWCPHWPHAYFGLAASYYFLQEWAKVVHWAEVGQALPAPETLCIINPMDYKYNWIIYYTNALYHVGRQREALAWTHRALQMCPGDTWHRANWDFFHI
jgi:glycosyltransferase involved in cell wall biosynthesis